MDSFSTFWGPNFEESDSSDSETSEELSECGIPHESQHFLLANSSTLSTPSPSKSFSSFNYSFLFQEPIKSNVYSPSDDSFLLADAISEDLKIFPIGPFPIVSEVGIGSGVVSALVSKSLLNLKSFPWIIGTDINIHALNATQECFKLNIPNITPTLIQTSMLDSCKLKLCLDLLYFNPPYVPTSEDEYQKSKKNKYSASWAGGLDGSNETKIFFQLCSLYLKPKGRAFCVVLEENISDDLNDILVTLHLKSESVASSNSNLEKLYIWKITKKPT